MTDSSQWATPTGAPMVAPVEMPASPPPSRASRRRPLALGIGILGLAGLGVVGYLALSGGGDAPGASSPEAAVQGLVRALDNDDALGALVYVAPDEVDGLSAVIEAVEKTAADSGVGTLSSGGDMNLQLELKKPRVASLSDNAARVDIEFSGSFAASGALAELVGDGKADFAVDKLRLITVKIKGGWFISPMLSLGDYVADQLDLPKGDYREVGAKRAKTSGGKTAQDAVDSMLNGVADFDRSGVSDALASGEARFVDVYGDAIDELLARARDEMSQQGLTVELSDLGLEQRADSSVALLSAQIDYSDQNGSGEVSIDDDCVSTSSSGGNRDRGCVLTNAPFTTPMPEQNVVFATAKQDGAYRVQLLKSIAAIAADVAVRLDKPTVLEALGAEVLDTATPLKFGEKLDGSFTGERYQVFEVEIPAGETFTLNASGPDDFYINSDTYVRNKEGRWEYFYNGEPTSEATTSRIVVTADCTDSGRDSSALIFKCSEYQSGDFVVAAQPVKTANASFLDSTTITLDPGQSGSVSFTVTQETDAFYSFQPDDGGSGSGYVSGPNSYNDNGSYHWTTGDYTATVVNTGNSTRDFTLTFDEVVIEPPASTPTDISSSSPTTTFDLAASDYYEFGAYANDGDYVVITASPNDGQDIVLNVASSSGDVCSLSSGGDNGGAGGSESCSFTVTSGGRFAVYVFALTSADSYGTVTVGIALN